MELLFLAVKGHWIFNFYLLVAFFSDKSHPLINQMTETTEQMKLRNKTFPLSHNWILEFA